MLLIHSALKGARVGTVKSLSSLYNDQELSHPSGHIHHNFQRCVFFTFNTGEGNGNPLQYSCLKNPVDRGAWWVIVHGIIVSDSTKHTCTIPYYCTANSHCSQSYPLVSEQKINKNYLEMYFLVVFKPLKKRKLLDHQKI